MSAVPGKSNRVESSLTGTRWGFFILASRYGKWQDVLGLTLTLPTDVGFTAKFNWTLQIIADFIRRSYGFSYSLRGISKLMERMGMSYTKPTYTFAAAVPA